MKKSTFWDLTEHTKVKHAKVADKMADLHNGKPYTREDIMLALHNAYIFLEDRSLSEQTEDLMLERARMASIWSGPDTPTIDLVQTEEGTRYVFLRNGEIPGGFIRHSLKSVVGFPRLCFDNLMIIGGRWGADALIEGLTPTESMLLVVLTEAHIRLLSGANYTTIELEPYLKQMAELKNELRSKLTHKELRDINAAIGASLLLPEKAESLMDR